MTSVSIEGDAEKNMGKNEDENVFIQVLSFISLPSPFVSHLYLNTSEACS